MARSRRLIWLYYAYRVTNSMGFYIPVYVVYLLDQDLGVGFVAITQATFSFALLAAEVPTGYLGDRIGRRSTLAFGTACRVVALVGYVFAHVGAAFLLIKVVMATGWALRSGTEDAWLFEVLKEHSDEEEFTRIQGRGSSALLATSAATAVAGGFLYGVDHRLPFLCAAALNSVGFAVLYVFPSVEGEVDEDPFTVREALGTLREQVRRPRIRWVVAYTVLIFLVFDLSRTFEQPALQAVGVPVAGMGVLYAAFKLVTAGAASSAGWLRDRLGTKGVMALYVPVLGVAYGSIALAPVMVVPVLFLYRGSRTVLRPVRNQYLNERLEDTGRATVLSGVSMALSLVTGVARLAGGPVAARVGPVLFLAGAGAGIAAVAGVLWVLVSPVRGEADAGVPEGAAGAD